MKLEDCKEGLDVFIEDDPFDSGIIVSVEKDGLVLVQYGPKTFHKFDPIDLTVKDLEKEKLMAIEYQAKIDKITDLFQKSFDEIASLNHNDNYFFYLKENKLVSTDKLESVFDSNGWSSSSLWC